MCPDLFSEEAPCGSIIVSDHEVFHFVWSLIGGSTVLPFTEITDMETNSSLI